MISVIICGKSPTAPVNLEAQIEARIGVPYELIYLNNHGEEGLGSTWNRGALSAKFPWLCFMHDDAEVLTDEWGLQAVEAATEYDLIGFAGSCYKSAVISGWYSGIEGLDHYHVIHGENGNQLWSNRKPGSTGVNAAICLDGAWMLCRRTIWEQAKFDEENRSFHFYDVDFSLRVAMIGRVGIWHGIELRHYSSGRFDEGWILAGKSFLHKWTGRLPLAYPGLELPQQAEQLVASYWWHRLRKEEIRIGIRLQLWVHYRFHNKSATSTTPRSNYDSVLERE